jgi:hypothetical protein
MAESFLKEQLERIRRMTERMSALESSAAELSDVMAHDRAAMRQGPLHQVRDYRVYSHTLAARDSAAREDANDTPAPRRAEGRNPPRRRRRG